MRIIGPLRLQWELFVDLYHIFQDALPSRSKQAHKSPTAQNDATLIRQIFRSIPLVLPNIDLNCNLEESKYNAFSEALLSVLEVLETLVAEDVREPGTLGSNFAIPKEESDV
jgi:hypothetical protein